MISLFTKIKTKIIDFWFVSSWHRRLHFRLQFLRFLRRHLKIAEQVGGRRWLLHTGYIVWFPKFWIFFLKISYKLEPKYFELVVSIVLSRNNDVKVLSSGAFISLKPSFVTSQNWVRFRNRERLRDKIISSYSKTKTKIFSNMAESCRQSENFKEIVSSQEALELKKNRVRRERRSILISCQV